MIIKLQSVLCHWTLIFYLIFPLMISGRSNQLKSQLCQSSPIQDTVKILWTDGQDNIRLNDIFLCNMTEIQRAALGYIAIQCGSDCRWDGPKNSGESNLRCKLTDALNLGYMCSSAQISYLEQWFRNDKTSLERLQYCSKKPADDMITDKFTDITFITEPEQYTIIYNAKGANFEDLSGWEWETEIVFDITQNQSLKVNRWKNLSYYRFKL